MKGYHHHSKAHFNRDFSDLGLIRNGGKNKPDGSLLGNEGIVEDHFCVVIIERTNLKPFKVKLWLKSKCALGSTFLYLVNQTYHIG